MSEQRWRVVLERGEETGDWAAWCPELPGCASAGANREEAKLAIREAIALHLQPEPLDLEPSAEVDEVTVRCPVASGV